MKKSFLFLMVLLALVVFTGDAYASGAESIYGHISYIEGKPLVTRADQTQDEAVVNLPIAPGDIISTGPKARCEFQFDNGTVMRLDKNSKLKIVTILAKTLTSKWKVTTLKLLEGKLYSLNQSYNQERFQVLTPHAAVDLKRGSTSTIQLKDDATLLFSDRGKFRFMYGDKDKGLHTENIGKGDGFMVSAKQEIKKTTRRDIDFRAWNTYINKNFKELHYGISKLPKKIYKFPKGIVEWAEKWSTMFGDWVYDELLGYVWKPANRNFAYSARPFIHAKYVNVNNEMFLVPTQPWGWAPAHLGTWVWMDWGWTWVPGSAFNPGLVRSIFPNSPMFQYGFYSGTLNFWLDEIYGGYDHYCTYRRHGARAWHDSLAKIGKTGLSRPSLKNVPKDIRLILNKLNKAPLAVVKKRLGVTKPEMSAPVTKTPVDGPIPGVAINKPVNSAGTDIQADPAVHAIARLKYNMVSKDKNVEKKKSRLLAGIGRDVSKLPYAYRDWNPDLRWAMKKGVDVFYSSRTNQMVAPKLKLFSNRITAAQRSHLKNGNRPGYGSGVRMTNMGSGSGGSGVSDSGSSSGSFSSSVKDGSKK